MSLRLLLLFLLFLVTLPDPVGAKEVRLKKGEVYRDRDVTVICEDTRDGVFDQVLKVRECQYWDDFAQKCLFERTIYTFDDLTCVEECKHWDSFKNTCDYQNKCTFFPKQEAFVLGTCAEFDDYNRKCLKPQEEKIGK